ncbi:MAG: hypothetical protein ACRBBQ_18010, partial [Cognatishimia sp.]
MSDKHFVFEDDSELALRSTIANHHEEALSRVTSLLAQTTEDKNGCWVTATVDRSKIRFRGRQVSAARFVYCVVNRAVI